MSKRYAPLVSPAVGVGQLYLCRVCATKPTTTVLRHHTPPRWGSAKPDLCPA